MSKREKLILIAEDDETLRFLVAKQLAKLGWQGQFALNGKEAVEKAREVKFDLILMDIMMPLLDGYEAARLIRENEQAMHQPHTPIVAMTAYANRNPDIPHPMDDFLFKPVLLHQLEQIILHWLGQDR